LFDYYDLLICIQLFA